MFYVCPKGYCFFSIKAKKEEAKRLKEENPFWLGMATVAPVTFASEVSPTFSVILLHRCEKSNFLLF
jgi:hypothetical protein